MLIALGNMIYPSTIEDKIGFDQIRRLVLEKCISPRAREMAEDMSWMTSEVDIEGELYRVFELKTLMLGDEAPELTPICDARPWLSRIEVQGMYIEAQQLHSLGRSLSTAHGLKCFFERDENARLYPRLAEVASGISDVKCVIGLIDRIVDQVGEVRDSASRALSEIRHELSGIDRRAATAMRRVIQSAVSSGLIEADTTPAVRDGRLVIPVSPAHKRSIEGIIHDQSASGKTVFIEPSAVVELTNRRRELQMDERREIVRILIEVADNIRPHIESLYTVNEIMARFDFIAAKASVAIATGGNMPRLDGRRYMEWHGAIHPVLYLHLSGSGRSVVPLDMRLSKDDGRIVVVSGPNAGGKSVALKTVGIVQYMTQCGMLPTMRQGSVMMVMRNIMIDIGDDQSIDNDLSTYSSHLAAMKYFVTHGDSHTLFLADEMGGGTEPQIGGAIAQALLEEFNNKGMWGMVTTHYQNLKTLADETPGLINASMLYDRRAMAPLFKLDMGHPGSSFAIEIARKTGLPATIIERAGDIVGSDYVNLDKYLLDIARDKRYWADKRENIRRRNKDLEDKIRQYTEASEEINLKRREILSQAQEEAREIVASSNAVVERTIREIRQAQAERDKTREARLRLSEYAGSVAAQPEDMTFGKHLPPINKPGKRRDKSLAKTSGEPGPDSRSKTLYVDDYVLLDGKGAPGQVISVSGHSAVVAFGVMKLTVPVDRLTKVTDNISIVNRTRQKNMSSAAMSDDSRRRQLEFKTELDVRGFRADEALQAITYFIDDAVQFSISRVRILHGTGTGALRMATRQYLSTVQAVKAFHDEDVRMGGAGITVVEL